MVASSDPLNPGEREGSGKKEKGRGGGGEEYTIIPYTNSIAHTHTQLSAYNVGVLYPPTAVTHCPPCVVVVNFHISHGKILCIIRGVSTIDQTNR